MADVFELTIQLKRNGVSVANFPLTRRFSADEAQSFLYEQANQGAGTFAAIPLEQLGTINGLVVTPDQQVTIRLDGQTDAGIVLNQGGVLLILDATIDAGAGSSNASLNNVSGSTATIQGIGLGT